MVDVEPGAVALRLATTLLTVIVSRDKTIAAEVEQVLEAYRLSAPTEADQLATAHCIAAVQVALARARTDHEAADRERAPGDKPH